MVNSPSRPYLRPVDPPSLGASVRHAFSLPHPGHRLRAGRGQFEIPLLPVAVRKDHQGRIKAKTPAIVPNQGKSRQTVKILFRVFRVGRGFPSTAFPISEIREPKPDAFPSNQGKSRLIKPYQGKRKNFHVTRHPSPEFHLGDFATPRLCVKSPASSHNQASIKAKSPVIVHNQGKSRQTPKFPNTFVPTDAGLVEPVDEWSNSVSGENPLSGERTEVRASVSPINPPLRLRYPQQSRQIKAHQALSRQTRNFPWHLASLPGIPLCDFAPASLR